MSVFISHRSALGYWRHVVAGSLPAPLSQNQKVTNIKRPSANKISFSRRLLSLPLHQPLDTLVFSAEERFRTDECSCHVWTSGATICTFSEIEQGVFVSSPEAVFLQMAHDLSLTELTALGCELCGSYALLEESGGFAKNEHGSLTSTTRIESLLETARGIHGIKQARRALKHVADNSASPMETALYLLLCLPVSQGGFGMKKPRMNRAITVKGKGRSSDHYVCDLFWEESKVAVEYDSDQFHTGSARIAKDSRRRNELLAQGVTVITATRAQVMNYREMEKLARVIGKAIGAKNQRGRYAHTPKRTELRKLLLPRFTTQ